MIADIPAQPPSLESRKTRLEGEAGLAVAVIKTALDDMLLRGSGPRSKALQRDAALFFGVGGHASPGPMFEFWADCAGVCPVWLREQAGRLYEEKTDALSTMR